VGSCGSSPARRGTARTLGLSDRDIAEASGWESVQMVSWYLGQDPAGVAERLTAAVANRPGRHTRTKPARFARAAEARAK